MLNIVGLGLSTDHLTHEARSVIAAADKVYLDVYTSLVPPEVEQTVKSLNAHVIRAERHVLEDGMRDIVQEAKTLDVAVAVPGDPFAATTHISLYVLALREGVGVRYVPGISIHTVAMSLSGLQHYRFGATVTVPSDWKGAPSFYERIARNLRSNLHTLLLLDLHPEPLTIREAIEAILYWEERRGLSVLSLSDLVVGIARAGWRDCRRYVGTAEELLDTEWPPPPHTLVIPAQLHPVEEEVLYALRRFRNGRC